ncbi:MAG: transporter,ATP-binding protein [Acidimicrobiaceae bacterium]|nr:transporter,ATP-binding protein [Acidimicrobiaceae bacterium]
MPPPSGLEEGLPSPSRSGPPLLEVTGLEIVHRPKNGAQRTILAGVDLEVGLGETIGIVGESGSGKSMLAKAVARLLPREVHAGGSVRFRGTELLTMRKRQMDALRGSGVTILYQDPFTMLNPLLRCGDHIIEGLPGGTRRGRRRALRDEAVRRLAEVGIDNPDVVNSYPFELSGGMRQRVALAAALASDPALLVADEPSTALDVTTQAEVLELLRSTQVARGMGLVLITHDLRVAFSVCARVYVLYAGSVLESAPANELDREPLHPYSLGLLVSDPPVDRRVSPLPMIEGSVPSPGDVTNQCNFAARCAWAEDVCRSAAPPLVTVGPARKSACVRISEIRPALGRARAELLQASPPPAPVDLTDAVLRVRDLRKVFAHRGGRPTEALRGVSLDVGRNESVGLVGESGSGKTTLARCLVGLETPTSGTIEIAGLEVGAPAAKLHKTVQIVFQDPYSSLDPRQTVGSSVRETLRANGCARGRLDERVAELFAEVGLSSSYLRRLPARLSGGERQRVAIARALAVEPELIICDEPVSALDVSVQAQVLNLFTELRERLGLSYLFITHDLAVVRQVVDRIYVCYRGEIVEHGTVDKILDAPEHAYTARLIASIPGATASSARPLPAPMIPR